VLQLSAIDLGMRPLQSVIWSGCCAWLLWDKVGSRKTVLPISTLGSGTMPLQSVIWL